MHARVAPRLPIVRFVEERNRRQRVLAVGAVGLVLAWQALRAVARTLLDRWWLDSVTDAPVWSRRTVAQLEAGATAAVFVAVVLGGTVWLVLRIARVDHGPRHRMWERYEQRVGPAHAWALVAIAAYLTWHIARAGGAQWQDWLLYWRGGDTGVTAPEVGGDIGFYLFRLPLLTTASSLVRQLLLLSLAIALFGHAASGALRLRRDLGSTDPAAAIHLGLLATGFLAAQAVHEVVVARAATATNRIGAFDGPGYTEVNVTRPALVIASFTCVALGFAIVNATRSGRWRVAVVIAAVTATVHVVGLVAAPYASEQYLVAPAEAERQLWSIEHNLEATRIAYDLDAVETGRSELHEGLDPDEIARLTGSGTAAIPLFGTDKLAAALQVQAGTPGTRVFDVDLGPYADEAGTIRPVYTAARSASQGDLPERGWVQRHLVYTHGDGVVALAADVVDADGRPDLQSLDGFEQVAHRPLYFGERLDGWYVITNTRREEYDGTRYAGEGVALDSIARRAVLALAVGEAQPVLTNELGDDALLLYRRSLTERITQLAPFLTLDSDPYAVVDGDRVVWVVDAYTTAATYPYAQFIPVGTPAKTPLARTEQNYIRASVKATVDATDGTVHLYRTDLGDDPIVEAWAEIFPGLFEPIDELPSGIREHLRYPTDLLSVQTTMLGRYHVDRAEQLFNGADRWAVSAAPANVVGEASTGPAPAVDVNTVDGFSATRTFGPGASDNSNSTRDELAGVAIGTHGGVSSLRLVIPDGATLLSPQVAQSAIDADPDLAQAITLLNANGSHVEFGPMTPLLVGEGVAWARPITVIGTSPASVPRLYGVAVVSDGLVGLGPTVVDAFASIDQSSAE